jgi:hypothetical protein
METHKEEPADVQAAVRTAIAEARAERERSEKQAAEAAAADVARPRSDGDR